MAGTVKVSNISSKATIKEIEEFFSFSGPIESINLNSAADDTQIAYVTFMDQESVKIALLLSGSAILDKEVSISPISNSAAESLTVESSPEGGGSTSVQARPTAINRAQEIMRSMLSRGFSVGKDAMQRTNPLDERNKQATDGDALEIMANGNLGRRKSEEIKMDKNALIAEELAGNSNEGKDKDRTVDDISDMTATVEGKIDNGDYEGVAEASQGDRQGKGGGNNVRMSMQKCYKHVRAMNEKLQLGQRTLAAFTTAQQGVAHAGSAVANNKLVSAGGVWVSGALSRVSLRNSSTPNHVNDDGGESSSAQQNERVQLTEMTTFSSHKSEHD